MAKDDLVFLTKGNEAQIRSRIAPDVFKELDRKVAEELEKQKNIERNLEYANQRENGKVGSDSAHGQSDGSVPHLRSDT